MKTMTNPKEWLKIQMTYRPEQIMKHADSNFKMRSYINSYGFRAPRELAQQILEMLEA
jgi:hypothetical protein